MVTTEQRSRIGKRSKERGKANKDGLMTFVKRHCIRPEKDYE